MCQEFAIHVLGDTAAWAYSAGEVDWVQVQVGNQNVPMAPCPHLTNYGKIALAARKDVILILWVLITLKIEPGHPCQDTLRSTNNQRDSGRPEKGEGGVPAN